MFIINHVFLRNDVLERILWISLDGQQLVTISLNGDQTLPIWQERSQLEVALLAGELEWNASVQNHSQLRLESELPETYRQKRDTAWLIIEPLVATPNIFYPSWRGPQITERAKQTSCTKKTIYGYLRRYWQGGQQRNALLPRYDRCGGRGQSRSPGAVKRGRPSLLSQISGQPRGVNITDEMQQQFRRGIRQFYENEQKTPLTQAYQRTLEAYFNEGYDYQDGVWVPLLPSSDQLPTFHQFRYWYEKERDLQHSLIAREGQRRFNHYHRAVTGSSTQMAFGPGSLFQIDATGGDIYLVSELDRQQVLGMPVIYMVIDVFSRMIVGFSVSLENPSWLGAMLALENVTLDKVVFCHEHGITIQPQQWTCHYLPERLLADRGELEGYDADQLVLALNIQVANTPPYRADWKGIVERHFRLTNDRLIRWLPGASYAYRERGDSDYRLGARLTLSEFRQLLIHCILYHNQHHRMDWYPLEGDLIADGIEPYPLDLWQWGLTHRAGHLRQVQPDIVRMNLLPKKMASVSRRGILFEGLHYTCELAQQEQWFVKARQRWKIPVVYDPRSTDVIYLRLEHGQRLEPCYLLERDRVFKQRNWYEVMDYHQQRKLSKEVAQTRQQQATAHFHAQIDHIVQDGVAQTDSARQGESVNKHHMRATRQLEREIEREKEQWLLTEQVEEASPDTAIYISPPQPFDQLRQIRDERNPSNGE